MKMTSYRLKPSLRKILNKLSKKDKETYEQILNKIDEIINCENINHYKNISKILGYRKTSKLQIFLFGVMLAFAYTAMKLYFLVQKFYQKRIMRL